MREGRKYWGWRAVGVTLDFGLILLTVAKSGSVREGMDLADDVEDQGVGMVLDFHYYLTIFISPYL